MKVYIAGPLRSSGDVLDNTREAIRVADAVMELGHTPYIPHLWVFWDFVTKREEERYAEADLPWLRCCDALIRFEGESSGADHEVNVAREEDIPVYFGVDAFRASLDEDGRESEDKGSHESECFRGDSDAEQGKDSA